jgi:MFS family permease
MATDSNEEQRPTVFEDAVFDDATWVQQVSCGTNNSGEWLRQTSCKSVPADDWLRQVSGKPFPTGLDVTAEEGEEEANKQSVDANFDEWLRQTSCQTPLDLEEQPAEENEEDLRKEKRRMVGIMLAHQLSIISISLLTMQPRTELFACACNRDTSEIAKYINSAAAMVALSDFIVSPALGSLSDSIGRRPCMLIGPALTLPFKILAAVRPTLPVLLAERVVCDALRTMTGTTMVYTCLSDLYAGTDYTQALANLSAATGLAIVGAPLVSGFCSRLGSPRLAYVFSSLLSALHLAVGLQCLPETLTVKKKPAETTVAPDRAQKNPAMQFLRLFTRGARLRARAMLFTLHSMIEGKVLQDQVSVLQLGADWSIEARSQWTSGLGFAILSGSQIARVLLPRLGEFNFTSLTHAASMLAFLRLQRQAFWGGLICMCIGQQRRHTSSSWVINEALATGMGKGEATGCLASLRSVVDFGVSILFSKANQMAAKRGRQFDVMMLPFFVAVAAELALLRVKAGQSKMS